MGRPRKAVVDYFPHYVSHGKTMFTIEGRFGNDGYAFWFKTLEVLGSTENHFIDCNDYATWEFLLAKTRLDGITANNILDVLAKCGSIDPDLWQKKIIWSQHFLENLLTVYQRRKVSVYTKSDIENLCIHKYHSSVVSDNICTQSKVKESKGKESNTPQTPQGADGDFPVSDQKQTAGFDEFWKAYPVKKSKGQALRSWIKLKKSKTLPSIETLLSAIAAQKKERDVLSRENRFVPEWQHPSSWLNAFGWENDTSYSDTHDKYMAAICELRKGGSEAFGQFCAEHGLDREEVSEWNIRRAGQ